jgi:hypothetical protein
MMLLNNVAIGGLHKDDFILSSWPAIFPVS